MQFDQQISDAKQHQHHNQRLKLVLLVVVVVLALAGIAMINRFADQQRVSDNGSGATLAAQGVENEGQTNATGEALRQQFKTALATFEQEIEPYLQDASLNQWREDQVRALVDGKMQGLQIFAQGDYANAIAKLKQLTEQTLTLVKQWDEAFAQHLSAAKQYFDQQDHRRATLNIQQALKIKRNDLQGQQWQQRIAAMPAVSQLKAAIKVSQTEHNLQSEQQLLNQLIQLDPNQTEAAQRLSQVQSTLKDQAFSQQIQRGLQAIAAGDSSGATLAYQRAHNIAPQRQELNVLKSKISAYQTDTALGRGKAIINQYISEDNWPKVASETEQLLQQFANDSGLQQTQRLANQINRLDQQVAVYLRRPERLTDSHIRQQAQQLLLEQTDPSQDNFALNSFQLLDKLGQLEQLVKQQATPYRVMIQSDGRTDIIVVGVGHIGKTTDKAIELTPGEYALEGSRVGYRKVRVTFTVNSDNTNQTIKVICDERI